MIKFGQNCIFSKLVLAATSMVSPFVEVKNKKISFFTFYTVHIECLAGRSLPMSSLGIKKFCYMKSFFIFDVDIKQ